MIEAKTDALQLPINQILCGDCVDVMKTLPDESINMTMFSPPYYGLRDYGISGQIGLEEHPSKYIEKMVEVCREVKRILKKTGSMYIVIGDTYYGSGVKDPSDPSHGKMTRGSFCAAAKASQAIQNKYRTNWLQPKQLLGIPWRVAIALQEDDGDDIYELDKDLLAETLHLIAKNNAAQRSVETSRILPQLREEVESRAQRPISNQNERMAREEPREAEAISTEVLLDTQRTGNNQVDEIRSSDTSKSTTGSPDSLRGKSAELSMLRRDEASILNNRPQESGRKRQQPSKGNQEIRDNLSVVEKHEISRWIQSFMHELQLRKRQVWNVSSRGRETIRIKKSDIPSGYSNCFQFAEKGPSWILRNCIIWNKPNHMPSSVKDRLTNAYEHIFHFVKNRKYYYDLDAIREEHSIGTIKRITQPNVMNQAGGEKQDTLRGRPSKGNASRCNLMVQNIAEKYKGKFDGFKEESEKYGSPRARTQRHKCTTDGTMLPDGARIRHGLDHSSLGDEHILGKNPSDVLLYDSKYAKHEYGQTLQAFVREQTIAKRRVLSRDEAEKLFPKDPKKQQEYINYIHDHDSHMEGKNPSDFWNITTKPFKGAHFAVYPEEVCIKPIKSSCPKDGIVLDPMCGSGTTLVVAKKLGRKYIGIELNPVYIEIAQKRLAQFL